MASFTQYEDAAAAFLQVFPLGTKVRGEEIVAWATDHSDGLAGDLLIDDDSKRLSALRRHLNAGGSSRGFAESERFVIDVSDAKRKVFTIRRLADHVHDKAAAAFDKQVIGAISPGETAIRAIEDIKLEELDDAERAELELRRKELAGVLVPIKNVFKEQATERWIMRLEARGVAREAAVKAVGLIPQLHREMALIERLT
jgi:hypothetical protein